MEVEKTTRFVFVPIYLNPTTRDVKIPYEVEGGGEFVCMGYIVGALMNREGVVYYTGCEKHIVPGAIVYTTNGARTSKANVVVFADGCCNVQEASVPPLRLAIATKDVEGEVKVARISKKIAKELALKILDEFKRTGISVAEWEEADVDETADEYIEDWLWRGRLCANYYYL